MPASGPDWTLTPAGELTMLVRRAVFSLILLRTGVGDRLPPRQFQLFDL